MMDVTYFVQGDNGCDYYRAMQPLRIAAAKGAITGQQRTSYNISYDMKMDPGKFEKDMMADIIYVPRVVSYPFFENIFDWVKQGKTNGKICLDYDDNVFCVSPLSEHYRHWGILPYSMAMPDGSKHDIWVDKKNIDLEANKHKLKEMVKCMAKADLITVTNERLAQVYREYSDNVKVIPNYVDCEMFQRLPFKETDEIRLYWGGGSSHYEDFYQIREVLPVIMNKYKNTKLVLLGSVRAIKKWLEGMKGIPMDRVEFHNWVEVDAYPYKLSILNPDIGLVPLRDTEFNRCKSPIKWMEMASLETPCVTSFVPPYKKMSEKSKNDNGIFISHNDPEQWIKGISMLIENKKMRQEMGKEARKTVLKHFDINTKYTNWVDAFKEVSQWQHQPPRLLVNS